MTETSAHEIAARLSEAQKKYIIAVYNSGGDYKPRHGRAAFWALTKGITDSVLHYADGRTFLWDDKKRPTMSPFRVGGQSLTPLGLELFAILQEPNP